MAQQKASRALMSRHPLQRLDSPGRGVSAAIHILGIISFSLSYKYLVDFPSHINASYGWHWQYLTILGLTVAYLTFIFGLLADITLSPKLFLVKNTLSLCSAPLEVLISVLYWGISAIDKELLVPKEIQIAPLADIGFHAMPSILLVIDLLFLSPPWAIHSFAAMALSSAIAVGYWAWVEQCFKHNGLLVFSSSQAYMSDSILTGKKLSVSALRAARHCTADNPLCRSCYDHDTQHRNATMAVWTSQRTSRSREEEHTCKHQRRMIWRGAGSGT